LIPVERFAASLRRLNIDFFTGVPCSYMKQFVSYAQTCDDLPYVAAASEGEAIAIACGAFLAGRTPMVLIQNSGLGNCVNPLTSLALPYQIPMLLAVSHRGEAGQDAPQHRIMGEITYPLLELMGVAAFPLPAESRAADELLEKLCRTSLDQMRPVATVVSKGTFEPYAYDAPLPARRKAGLVKSLDPVDSRPLSRFETLQTIVKVLDENDLLISTTGMTSRELFSIADRDSCFYMAGSMGCAPGIALGLSLNRPGRRVVLIDGDGAFLMKMGTSATIGHYAPPGLVHIVLDNGTYETTGSQRTVSSSVAFERVAAAVGYPRALALPDADTLARVLSAFRIGDGPMLLSLRILDGHAEGVPRVGRAFPELRDRFRKAALAKLRLS